MFGLRIPLVIVKEEGKKWAIGWLKIKNQSKSNVG